MGEYIATTTAGMLNECAECTELDVVADFARRIPISSICEMLGVPAADHEQRGVWNRTTAQCAGAQLDDAGSPGTTMRSASSRRILVR